MKNIYCPLPFYHLAIRPNGRVYPCCNFKWEEVPEDFNINDPNVFNHPFLESIREKMHNGEKIDGCSKCYEDEKNTEQSTRTYFLNRIDEFEWSSKPTKDVKLTYLDLALSNTCNNKCRMCNADLSTSWYSDWRALGREIPKGILRQETVLKDYDFSEMKFIKLIGGEPLMEQDKFIDVLKRCNRSQLSILLTTNVTLTPNDELLRLLKECKNVTINLSIDAHGSLNDFLRKGSKWEKTVENIEWFSKNFSKKNDLAAHCVVSLYNINKLDKLYYFLKEKYPLIDLNYVLVDSPDWMSIRHLPEYVKDEIKNKIIEWKKVYDIPFYNILISELNKLGDFEKFIKNDKKLSDIRKENWWDYNPELYEMVKKYYE